MPDQPPESFVKLRVPSCSMEGRTVAGPKAKVVRCPACQQPITVPAVRGKLGMIGRLTYSLPRPRLPGRSNFSLPRPRNGRHSTHANAPCSLP